MTVDKALCLKDIYSGLVKFTKNNGSQDFSAMPFSLADKSVINLKIDHLLDIKDDKTFVEMCYMTLLNRLGDKKGVNARVVQLRAGVSRTKVIYGILGSDEYLKKNNNFFSEIHVDNEVKITTHNNLYVDITDYVNNRGKTGIQRAVNEIVPGFLKLNNSYIVGFNGKIRAFDVYEKDSVARFIEDPSNSDHPISIGSIKPDSLTEGDVFCDLDNSWNIIHKRTQLYSQLKKQKVKIVSYVYDVVPLIKPDVAHANTVRNFIIFMAAVYCYSDLVMTSSSSTERDICEIAEKISLSTTPSILVTKLSFNKNNTAAALDDSSLEFLDGKKYILFVGTVEPRKRQDLVLKAFLYLRRRFQDIHLVFVGKEGWGDSGTAGAITGQSGENVHWFEGVGDNDLFWLYEKSFIVTFISDYEGFGLPVVEGLSYGKPVITSDNSSIYEVGRDFADYLQYNSQKELCDILEGYLADEDLYQLKSEYIASHYEYPEWGVIRSQIIDGVGSVAQSGPQLAINKKIKKLQHVFISIRPDAVSQNIAINEKYADYVKDYLIVTSSSLVDEFKNLSKSIDMPMRIVDERVMLGELYEVFTGLDHLEKNWTLRSQLASLDYLDDNFVMLDDDNLLARKTTIEDYIDQKGRYIGYYFYDLMRWNHKATSFDKGMQRAKENSINFNLEAKAYASHRPQIINKKIFLEAISYSQQEGMMRYPSEWETYFNFLATKYPSLLSKKEAKVMNWPGKPSSWDAMSYCTDYDTENFYEESYAADGIFKNLSIEDQASKLDIKKAQIDNYIDTHRANSELSETISERDMVHTMIKYTSNKGSVRVYLSNVPYIIKVYQGSVARFDINYKIVGGSVLESSDVLEIATRRLPGQRLVNRKKLLLSQEDYQESTESIPLVPTPSPKGSYYSVVLILNGKELICDDGECLVFVPSSLLL